MPYTQEPFDSGDNIYGFSSLPGGMRFGYPGYYTTWYLYLRWASFWWTSGEINGEAKYCSQMAFTGYAFSSNIDYKTSGFSVRCVKDK